MARLSAAEVARYHAEGWVVPAFRLPTAQVDGMHAALDQLLRDNPGVRPEKLVSAHIEGDNGEGVRGSARFLQLAQDPEIVDLVSGVIGETSSSGAATSSASRPQKAGRHLGTRTATTGRSARWPPAPCGWRWSPR